MDDTTKLERLYQYADTWPTEMGGWFPGKDVLLRGKSLMTDLHKLPWMGVVIYSITGKIPDEQQTRLFESIWVIGGSFPEPRLWNNRIAALAGSARSTPVLGISAALAVSEATIYGLRPQLAAINFLTSVYQRKKKGEQLHDILLSIDNSETKGRPGCGKQREPAKFPGFGRPVVSGDERIKPLLALATELGCGSGEHVQLVFEIEQGLQQLGQDLHMNVVALVSALCSDQGLTCRQCYYFMTLCFSAGMIACVVDAEQHPEGSFFPLPCSALHYSGRSKREWKPLK